MLGFLLEKYALRRYMRYVKSNEERVNDALISYSHEYSLENTDFSLFNKFAFTIRIIKYSYMVSFINNVLDTLPPDKEERGQIVSKYTQVVDKLTKQISSFITSLREHSQNVSDVDTPATICAMLVAMKQVTKKLEKTSVMLRNS